MRRILIHWFLYLLLWHCHETVPELFSYPARRFLHARDWRRHHRWDRRSTHPVNGHRHRGRTSDLFSSRPRPELGGGALWTPAYTPGDGQTSWVYSSNLVLHLYIGCYVTVNKPVLSYLLLRLHPQQHFFRLRFCLEINSFFLHSISLLEVSRELPQRLTLNTSFVACICRYSLAQFSILLL
jgi:hypothetical protein